MERDLKMYPGFIVIKKYRENKTTEDKVYIFVRRFIRAKESYSVLYDCQKNNYNN